MMIVISLLATSCAISDAFRSESDDTNPRATATPESTPTQTPASLARSYPSLRHRFVINPPDGVYDPDLIAVSEEDEYLKDVAAKWASTKTVHFALEIDGATYLDVNETIELSNVTGDLARPNMTDAEAEVKIGFATFDVGLIVIGDDAYMTNFLTGDWERAGNEFDFNPALLFDEERGVGSVLQEMDNAEIGEESVIGGIRTVEISGTVEQEVISQIVGGSLRGDEIGIRLWLDAESSNLLQIHLSEPDDVEGSPTTWIVSFSHHNEPVTIEAPDI